MLYQLRRVSVGYAQNAVLMDVSLSIRAGEKIAVIGPSGSGKTTLLRHLFQMQPQQVGFVHQQFALVHQLSVFHNVFAGRLDQHPTWYNLRNLLLPAAEEKRRVCEVLEPLGLESFLRVKVARLSGGQQQRVAVARALFRAAPIILADEPVSSIDPHQAESVLLHLLASAETVVASLHSVQLARQLFPRLIGIRAGEICFDLPSERVQAEQLQALYGNETN